MLFTMQGSCIDVEFTASIQNQEWGGVSRVEGTVEGHAELEALSRGAEAMQPSSDSLSWYVGIRFRVAHS